MHNSIKIVIKKFISVFSIFMLGTWSYVFAPQMALKEDQVDAGSVLDCRLEELNQAVFESLKRSYSFKHKEFRERLEVLIKQAESSGHREFVGVALNRLVATIAPSEDGLGVFQQNWLNVLASVAVRCGYSEVVAGRLYDLIKKGLERSAITCIFQEADVVWQNIAPKLIRCYPDDFVLGYGFYFVQMHQDKIDCDKTVDLLILIATQLVFDQSSDLLFAECMECLVQLFMQRYDALNISRFMNKVSDLANQRNHFIINISSQFRKFIYFAKAMADLNKHCGEKDSDAKRLEEAGVWYNIGCKVALSIGDLAEAKQIAELAGNPNFVVEHVDVLRQFCNSETNCIASRQVAVVKRRFRAMRLNWDVATLIAAFISPREAMKEDILLNWPQLARRLQISRAKAP